MYTAYKKILSLSLLFLLPVLTLCAEEKSGSWTQINQDLGRSSAWVQLVENTPFVLGDKMPEGEIEGTPLYRQAYGTYPCLDGSTVSVPMALEFARQHLKISDTDAEGFVFFSTTHHAYLNLIHLLPNGSASIASENVFMDPNHPVDIIIATEPSDEELALAEAAGVTLHKELVCLDAFVFITHADNPVSSLSADQIRAIYGGTIKNWSEVGGESLAITPYQREPNSGSQTAMENIVMQGLPLDGATQNYIEYDMGSLVYRVGNYENEPYALGYTYKYYIDTLYKNEDIKILAIDGIYPSPENLRNGTYPYTTGYYAVIRGGEEEALGGKFQQWMLSEEGQRCVAQAGYIPVMHLD